MARLGLGKRWECVFANDFCDKKGFAYKLNHKTNGELLVGDINDVRTKDISKNATLAWASFPCQDLSVAGKGMGLAGDRSGTFWPFWRLMKSLSKEGRKVPIIVLENVVGAVTANGGKDFSELLRQLASEGYRFGPLIMDAAHFVPQSRPRLFIVAFDERLKISKKLDAGAPSSFWHPTSLVSAYENLPQEVATRWLWWRLPKPVERTKDIDGIIEKEPVGVSWHPETETKRLMTMMSDSHRNRIKEMSRSGKYYVGTLYKRTRQDPNGVRAQRAEIRFDGTAGCLRTPGGGSSRQLIVEIDGGHVRTRLLSPREAARLMGLPDTYRLPEKYNEAYHLLGDGLVVPAVSWLERTVLRPLVGDLVKTA